MSDHSTNASALSYSAILALKSFSYVFRMRSIRFFSASVVMCLSVKDYMSYSCYLNSFSTPS